MRWLFASLALLLAGCADSPAPTEGGQVVRINLYTDPLSLDPRKANDITSTSFLLNVYEGLTRVDPSGEVVLAQAERVEISPDGLRYTFHLRPSSWSNGEPVRAADFANAWKSALDPTFPAPQAHLLYPIRGARAAKAGEIPIDQVGVIALDSGTLQVELERPCPYFLAVVTCNVYYPYLKQAFNGPYSLTHSAPYSRYDLEKNPYYWDADEIQIDQIVMHVVEDETTELYMFEQGELDRAGGPFSVVPFDAVPLYRQQGTLREVPMLATYWYQFNTDLPLFQNKKVRQAFSLAVDREKIIEHICRGVHLLPEGHPNLTFDQERARRLFEEGLSELRLDRDEVGPIWISHNSGAGNAKIAQALQQMWCEAFGISVRLSGGEWGVHLAKMRQQSYQIGRFGWYAQFDDPVDYFNKIRYESPWKNGQFERLVEAIEREKDPVSRKGLIASARGLLMEEMPIIPLYQICHTEVSDPRLKGVVHSHLGRLDFRWARWEAEE